MSRAVPIIYFHSILEPGQKHELCNLTPKYLPKRKENLHSYENLYTNVYAPLYIISPN